MGKVMKRKNTSVNPYARALILILFIISTIARCDVREKTIEGNAFWNNLSRFLAGMTVPEKSEFWKHTQSRYYQRYTTFMNNFWNQVEVENIDPIVPWRDENIPRKHSGTTVFYPLSGADFVNMYLLFPDAPRYLMIALEKPGSILQLQDLSRKKVQYGLSCIKRVIYPYCYLNYFQSRTMKHEMANFNITGVAPIILIFMARLNLRIIDLQAIGIESTGAIMPLDRRGLIQGEKPEATGIRIHFTQGEKVQEVIYFSMRLGDEKVSTDTGIGRYLNSSASMRTLMKSAVYLLHMKRFSGVRDFILRKSAIIVQDDSGIPFNSFDTKIWELKLYGVYEPPYKIKGCYWSNQQDLQKSYEKVDTVLPFNFGYGSLRGRNKSNLMIAIKKT